jgi:hypothetical protein
MSKATCPDMLKKFVDEAKKNWNNQHDIKILGFEIELYVQDISEKHDSTGIYSLLNNTWLVKPEYHTFKLDKKKIEDKAKSFMTEIDTVETELKKGYADYDKLDQRLTNVWKKIKDMRKSELDKDGELSDGNLTFKLLRRNMYIEKVLTLKTILFDKKYTK